MKTPTVLIIMDGFGTGQDKLSNAIAHANTPHLDALATRAPHCLLSASGLDVGLPQGQMGNSEVGHTNIGAGRVVFQDLPKISLAIETGTFFENEAYVSAMEKCKKNDSALHLMGLLSDGGVHSHISHLFALLRMAKMKRLTKVFIHCFLDGRDVSPRSALGYVKSLEDYCNDLGVGTIASVSGRYYAMDRDNRWDRVELAYKAVVCADAPSLTDPVRAIEDSYAKDITDEFFLPSIFTKEGFLSAGDSVIFFNFRPDRARELSRSIVDPDFSSFPRQNGYFPVHYVCTTDYDSTLPNVSVAYPKDELKNTFGEYISQLGLTQVRIAETEKYAHVTFFFNGGVEDPFSGESRVLIPSPQVATYDLAPEMSALAVAEATQEEILSGKHDVVIVNFANCDMVGHTGFFDAAVKAVETVDTCVGMLLDATTHMGGMALITADHGNAEEMADETGAPMTAHTTNPVPFYLVGANVRLRDGKLADIAPTMLDLMGLQKPAEMDGSSLIMPL